MEEEWLNNIEKFEEQSAKGETCTVWEYIGKPQYRLLNELSEGDVAEELAALLDYMNIKGISLDTLCEVEERELYRFILEELFQYKMDDMQVPGMQTCFIYEEFHPNAQYDIEQAYDYFLTMTLGKADHVGGSGYDLLYIDTEEFVNKDNKKLEQEDIIHYLNNFLNTFDYFTIESHRISKVKISQEENEAILEFAIHYAGRFNKCSDTVSFKGDGLFKLRPSKYGGWNIYFIDMPGIRP